jgi:hypothetical protein
MLKGPDECQCDSFSEAAALSTTHRLSMPSADEAAVEALFAEMHKGSRG